MHCYRHSKQSAVSQCHCGNFLCQDCRSIFYQSKCLNCNYDEICLEIQEVNTSLSLVKMSLHIAPLYILAAVLSIAFYQINFYIFSSYILPVAIFMVIGWAILRRHIWDAQKKQNMGDVVVEVYFSSIFSLIIKIVIVATYGWIVVPLDMIIGPKKISSLSNMKRQLLAEQKLAFSEINS